MLDSFALRYGFIIIRTLHFPKWRGYMTIQGYACHQMDHFQYTNTPILDSSRPTSSEPAMPSGGYIQSTD